MSPGRRAGRLRTAMVRSNALRVGPVLVVAAIAGYVVGGCAGDGSSGLPGLSGVTELPSGSLPTRPIRTETEPETTEEATTTLSRADYHRRSSHGPFDSDDHHDGDRDGADDVHRAAHDQFGCGGHHHDRRIRRRRDLGLGGTRARRCRGRDNGDRGLDHDRRGDHDDRRDGDATDGDRGARADVVRKQHAVGLDSSRLGRGGGRGGRPSGLEAQTRARQRPLARQEPPVSWSGGTRR